MPESYGTRSWRVITNIAEFLFGVVTMFCKDIVMKPVHSCEHILSIDSLTLYGQLYICIQWILNTLTFHAPLSPSHITIATWFLLKRHKLHIQETKASSVNPVWENLTSTYKTLQPIIPFSLSTRMKYKWIRYPGIKPESLKLLEEILGNKLQDRDIAHSGNKANNW